MGPYTPLIPVVLMLAAFAMRKFAPTGGWLHTLAGATFIAFCTGLLGAIAQAITAHGISTGVIVPAVATFAMSFIATASPVPAEKKEEERVVKPAGGFAAVGLLIVLALIGLLGLFFAASGCATAGGQALKACELGQLSSDAGPAIALGQAIAADPSSTVSDLESAAGKFLPSQFECAVQALLAWWASRGAPAVTANALMASSAEAQAIHAKDVLSRYMAAHKPTACGPAPARVFGTVDLDSPPFAPGMVQMIVANILAPPELPVCEEDGPAACRPVVIEDGQP